MKLSTHVLSSLDNWDANKKDFALMDACFALEGTARNLYGKDMATKKNYKDCIRHYFWLLERMGGTGLDLSNTKFEHVNITGVEKPDMADVIYHIFRCNFAHCKDVPPNYELMPSSSDINFHVTKNGFKIRENIIFGLLAISVFSKANKNNITEGAHYLSWGSSHFEIKDWWGREKDFRYLVENQDPDPIRVAIKYS